MKELLKKIGLVAFILIVGVISLKSCIVTVLKLDDNKVYEKVNSTGQIDRVFIISSNDIVFSKNLDGTFELAYFRLRGEEATHYFGPIYNVGTFPFGLRVFQSANNVFMAELELLDKMGSVSETTFDEIGEKYKSTIVIYEDSIQLNDAIYTKIDFQISELEKLKLLFEETIK